MISFYERQRRCSGRRRCGIRRIPWNKRDLTFSWMGHLIRGVGYQRQERN